MKTAIILFFALAGHSAYSETGIPFEAFRHNAADFAIRHSVGHAIQATLKPERWSSVDSVSLQFNPMLFVPAHRLKSLPAYTRQTTSDQTTWFLSLSVTWF